MLSFLIFFPFVAAAIIFLGCSKQPIIARSLTLSTIIIETMLVGWLFISGNVHGFSMTEHVNWIPEYGIQYLISIDGISLSLITLSCVLFIVSILSAWQYVKRWHVFGPLLLMTLSGIIGAFLALDLLLFYVFWEVMLIPIYFLLSFWGTKGNKKAAMKFILVTVTGSLLMLISLILLYLLHGSETGDFTFNYFALASHPLISSAAMPILFGFLIAFLIKVPGFPFHFWAPDMYREGDPSVVMLLSGVMANVGAYGLFRFCGAIFPNAMHQIAIVGMAFGALGTLYGAFLAFRQHDLRSVIAYSSISHMNLVVMAIFAWQLQALNGGIIQLIAHGLSVAGLFAVVAILQARGFTGEIKQMGGLYKVIPGIAIVLLFFIVASIGIPGLANFAGEILALVGSFSVSPIWTSVAAFSILFGVVYFLKAYGRIMLGPITKKNLLRNIIDLTTREKIITMILVLGVFSVGLAPNYLLQMTASSTSQLVAKNSTRLTTITIETGGIYVTP